jgi:hypothetical protein
MEKIAFSKWRWVTQAPTVSLENMVNNILESNHVSKEEEFYYQCNMSLIPFKMVDGIFSISPFKVGMILLEKSYENAICR